MLRSHALLSVSPRGGFVRLLVSLSFAAAVALGAARFAHAASFFEVEITAHDAAARDQFGFAVSLDGEAVVVGAPFGDDAGSESGGAYVFERNQGGADNWGELKKLVAPDAASGDGFGFAVSIAGDTIVVGAPFDDDAGSASGAVYVFERDVGGSDNWGFVKKLTAADAAAGGEFGFEVAIDGNTVVAGAPTADAVGSESGAVFIFERDAGGSDNWGQVKKLSAADAVAGDEFGFAVAISGDTIAVGAPFANGNTGSAYAFERALGGAGNWGQAKRLIAADADAGDQFGYSISISEDTILVGARFVTVRVEIPRPPAPGDPTPDPIEVDLDDAGAVYYFRRDDGGADKWGQVRKRTAANAEAGDQFGFAVAIHKERSVVGAPVAGVKDGGLAYVHERRIGGLDRWGRLIKLAASNARLWDGYGFDVALGADTVVVGAPETDAQCPGDRDCDSGSTYVYTVTQTRDAQRCINGLNASLAKVAAARAKATAKCVKNYAKTGSSAETCRSQPNSSVERAEQKALKQELNWCADSAPDFGATDAATVNDAATELEFDVNRDVFGIDLDAALATSGTDKDAAKCQGAVIDAIGKCRGSKLKEFNRCKKMGLKKAVIRASADLEDCWRDDPRGVVARACDPASGKLATRVLPRSCVSRGVDLASAFPGCGTADPADLAICVDRSVACRVCAALNRADDLSLDCDLMDDGVGNSSCP